jgi:hypothetical protein
MKITDIEIILKSKFGIVFNEEFIFNEVYIEEYNYLINKYDLNEYEQNILYYILNIQYPEKEKNTNTNTFQLVVSMYNEQKISRIIELLLCLSKNLQNKNISIIHILYEINENSDNINIISETIYILQNVLKLPIKITYTYIRHSYKYLFKYINENIVGNAIISNTDIIYDDSLFKIRNIDDDVFLCISRHNKNIKNGNVVWEPIILDLPEYLLQNIQNSFSHDTWIFQSPTKYPIYIEILLGKMFCDSYLNFKLSKSLYKCYNLANDIMCFHIQDNDSFSQIVSKNQLLLEEYMEELIYRESGNTEVIYALPIQDITHFYNKTNFSLFCSHSDFLKKYILTETEKTETETEATEKTEENIVKL